jgi:hypothetical protein
MTYEQAKAYAERAIELRTRENYDTGKTFDTGEVSDTGKVKRIGLSLKPIPIMAPIMAAQHWSDDNLAILGRALQAGVSRLTECEVPEGKEAERDALITQLSSLL